MEGHRWTEAGTGHGGLVIETRGERPGENRGESRRERRGARDDSRLCCTADILRVRTEAPFEILDLTPSLERLVAASRLETGWVSVQSRHTTCGLALNENEPRLLGDLAAFLERLAPRAADYAHDELHLRPDVPPDERANGHAHAKSLLLRAAETVHVAGGRLRLGRWQRLLLIECDGPRERELSLVALGVVRP